MKKYSAPLLMVAVALVFTIIHYYTGWLAEVDDAKSHNESATLGQYTIRWLRDTAENLQSEFWQLAVQFLLLAGALSALYIKVYEEDMEEAKQKIDRILELLERQR